MEELNTPIFAQAKVEYTKQLIEILYPHIFDGIKSIYDESKIIYSTKTGTPILLLFRELLEKVPIWNGEIIDSECSRIINNSKCDWIDDLVTAVFISHTKILTSIGPNQSFQKINVTIPKTSSFIHRCYINVARELWKNPYLLNESVPGHEYQRNSKEIENIIKYCVENTIRHLLPIKEILKEHLDNENDNLLSQKEELKKLLREELKSLKEDNKKAVDQEDSDDADDAAEDTETKDENAEKDFDEELLKDALEEDALKGDKGPVIVKEEDTVEQKGDQKSDKTEDKTDDKTDDKTGDKGGDKVKDLTEDKKGDEDGDDLLPDIKKELEKIIAEDNELPLIMPAPSEPEPASEPTFSSSDDPSDEQVAKQCSDIVVNDITIPVEVPGEKKEDEKLGTEMKYDNVDIVSVDQKKVQEKQSQMSKLMQNKDLMEVNVIKSNDISTAQEHVSSPSTPSLSMPATAPATVPAPEPTAPTSKPSFSLNNLYPNMSSPETKTESQPEPQPQPQSKPTNLSLSKIPETEIKVEKVSSEPIVKAPEEPKSPRKEQVAVDNKENDIDETSSLAHFFQDMKDIAVKKGIPIETNAEKKFTLFEDAPEVEKVGA